MRAGVLACVVGWALSACSGDEPDPVPQPMARPAPASAGPAAAVVRNVVIVSIDTLRADRLQPYGYRRETSPNLAALSQRGVLFERAQAQSSQTAPSHGSLFTSSYGETHGLVNVHGDATKMRTLPPGLVTLAEAASRGGLETAAFVSNGNLTRGMGMDRGFGTWDERNEEVSKRVVALMSWLADPGRGRFLALLHTYQVHAPYVPPREVAERFIDRSYAGPLRGRLEKYWTMPWEQQWAGGVGADYWEGMLDYSAEDVRFLSDLYDGEIAYADDQLRPLFQEVLAGPRSTDTALIVLSDHGEEFKEHGKFQHDQVFQELLHVPLLVSVPAAATRIPWTGRVSSPVELVDVAPTVAELLGLDVRDAVWEGRSLVPLLDPLRRAGAGDAERALFSELTMDSDHGVKRFRSVVWRGWKYIHGEQPELRATWEWLFDLESDPGERKDRLADRSPEASEMLSALRKRLDDHSAAAQRRAVEAGRGEAVEVPDELRESLNQLGYIGK